MVDVHEPGYGAALMGGIEASRGRLVIMGDADDSYDFSNLMPFVSKLREGCDLVMGNRFKGGIERGAPSVAAIVRLASDSGQNETSLRIADIIVEETIPHARLRGAKRIGGDQSP